MDIKTFHYFINTDDLGIEMSQQLSDDQISITQVW